MAEQRNPYRGARPWLRLNFRAADRSVHTFDLIADTGCAPALVLRPDVFALLLFEEHDVRHSNLGEIQGGWVQLYMPECSLVESVLAYGSARGGELAARAHPDFVGLIGLPLLRLGEYGGNATDFWFRYPPTTTTTSTP